ncbi:MAG: HAMP domain-containing protein [Myxococcales bacterium]|nr:HAMP domain-containing protein [Myxococcales bacterium]
MIRRIDIKILLILVVTALVPMIVSVRLVAVAVRTALHIGINDDMEDALAASIDAQRARIETLKAMHAQQLAALARSAALTQACRDDDPAPLRATVHRLMSHNSALRAVRIHTAHGPWFAQDAPPLPQAADAAPQTLRQHGIALDTGVCQRLEADFAVDRDIAQQLKRAGETHEVFLALQNASHDYLSQRITLAYALLLGTAVLLSILGGFYWTRRMARRLHDLNRATQRVARGDLTIHIPPGGRDEISELITSFNQMVAEMAASQARVEFLQKIATWQEVARRLAHEIKNPLTPIQLAAQELQTQYTGDDPRYQSLLAQSTEIIQEEVEVLRRLVSHFSAFARMPKIEPVPTDLAEFMGDLQAATQHMADEFHMTITWRIPEAPRQVPLDTTMMRRVLDNLIRNAGEALEAAQQPDRSVTISAQLVPAPKQSELHIRVADNGAGIPAEHRATLFDPYFTTRAHGTGLGLAICKKTILEHGGRIYLDEQHTPGTAFVIALPADATAAPTPP